MNLVETLAPGLSGIETLRALIALGGQPPIGETLGFKLTEVEDGTAVFTATPTFSTYNPIGTVHGGYISTLLDSACGCAVHSRLNSKQAYTTVDLKVTFQRPVTVSVGTVRAEGRVQSVGKRVAFAEADLKDMGGRLYATATSTLLIMER